MRKETMTVRRPLWALVVLLACASAGWTAETRHQVKSLGGPSTAFYLPPLKTPADLQKMVKERSVDIQTILTERGWKGNIEDLMKAVATGDIKETTIDPGAPLPYMSLRKGGKPMVYVNVVWAGKKPFEAYYVEFASAGIIYRFYVPKPCGNFWMEQVGVVPPPPPTPKPTPPPTPAPTPTPEPPKPTPVVQPVVAPPPAEPELGMFFVAGFVGKERMDREEFAAEGAHHSNVGGRCAPLVGAEIGFIPQINDYLEAELALGVKLNCRDTDNSDIYADALLAAILPRSFVGAGLSVWDMLSSETHTVAMLAEIGVDITQNRQWQLVGEGRLPIDELDDIGNNYQFWGGLRFRP